MTISVVQELGIHTEICEGGYQQLSLYSPYWMINKTERDLAYKVLRCDCDWLVLRCNTSHLILTYFILIFTVFSSGSFDA